MADITVTKTQPCLYANHDLMGRSNCLMKINTWISNIDLKSELLIPCPPPSTTESHIADLAERQRLPWMEGMDLCLDTFYFSEGETSVFPPSDLAHRRQELKEVKCCSLPMRHMWYGGLWDTPAPLICKEIQNDSTSPQSRGGGRTLFH